jgi:hypothetical protein
MASPPLAKMILFGWNLRSPKIIMNFYLRINVKFDWGQNESVMKDLPLLTMTERQLKCKLIALDNQKYPACYPPTLPPQSLDLCFGTRNPATLDCPWFSCKLWPHDPTVNWTDAEKASIINDLVSLTQHLSQKQNLVLYQRNGHDEIWHVAYIPK